MNAQMKTQIMKLLGYGVFAYLDIPIEIFNILVTFILLDTCFGVLKAYRLGQNVRIKLLLWGFCLKISILILPLIVALLAKGLQMDFVLLIDIVIKILILSEAYSVFGNIYAIKNKKELKKMDIISMALIAFRKMTKYHLEKALIKIEQAGDCEKK
jgi:hypothetical protein